MISESLMEKQKYLKQELDIVQKAILEEVSKLDLESKIKLALVDCDLLVNLLGKDLSYCGVDNISLYDELYWERYETKTIEELIEYTLDDVEDGDEEDYLLTSDSPRAVIIRDMLNNNIGTAIFDW